MSVDTTKVQGRRKVRYADFDELVADAERLAAGPVESLGNWSLGQTLAHIGRGMEGSIDGPPFKVYWWLKLIGPILIKPRLVKGPFPAGFKLPGSAARKLVATPDTTTEQGMQQLHRGIERLRTETQRVAHPVAGKLNIDEWNSFHLRHAELHMSFLKPAGAN